MSTRVLTRSGTTAGPTLARALHSCSHLHSTGVTVPEMIPQERERRREGTRERKWERWRRRRKKLRSSKPRLWPCSTLSTWAHFLNVRIRQTWGEEKEIQSHQYARTVTCRECIKTRLLVAKPMAQASRLQALVGCYGCRQGLSSRSHESFSNEEVCHSLIKRRRFMQETRVIASADIAPITFITTCCPQAIRWSLVVPCCCFNMHYSLCMSVFCYPTSRPASTCLVLLFLQSEGFV